MKLKKGFIYKMIAILILLSFTLPFIINLILGIIIDFIPGTLYIKQINMYISFIGSFLGATFSIVAVLVAYFLEQKKKELDELEYALIGFESIEVSFSSLIEYISFYSNVYSEQVYSSKGISERELIAKHQLFLEYLKEIPSYLIDLTFDDSVFFISFKGTNLKYKKKLLFFKRELERQRERNKAVIKLLLDEAFVKRNLAQYTVLSVNEDRLMTFFETFQQSKLEIETILHKSKSKAKTEVRLNKYEMKEKLKKLNDELPEEE